MIKFATSFLTEMVTYYKHPAHLIHILGLLILINVLFALFGNGQVGLGLLVLVAGVALEIAQDMELMACGKVKS
jgi:hypothetical protein